MIVCEVTLVQREYLAALTELARVARALCLAYIETGATVEIGKPIVALAMAYQRVASLGEALAPPAGPDLSGVSEEDARALLRRMIGIASDLERLHPQVAEVLDAFARLK